MKITQETLKKLEDLSAFTFPEDEKLLLLTELNNILEWAKELNKINTDNVKPTTFITHSRLENHLREDFIEPCPNVQEILKNAPGKKMNFFTVPKVIE